MGSFGKKLLAGVFVHGDASGDTDINRAGGAKRFDVADIGSSREQFCGEAVVFGAEEEGSVFGERFFMEREGARGIVFDGDQFPVGLGSEEVFKSRVVEDGKVFVGTHSAATVVFFLADDMDFRDIERVGGADDGADVKIVLEVFDGDFERKAGLFESGKNLVVGETFEGVDEIAGVFHKTIVA